MSQICVISGLVIDANGNPLAGAAIKTSRVRVDNARQSTYENVVSTTDSSGAFSFSVPFASKVRFTSVDVSAINSFNYQAPSNVTANIGNFRADIASEVGARGAANSGSVPSAVKDYVSVAEYGDSAMRKIVLTLTNLPVTLVKNGTSTGGGGTKIYTNPVGLHLNLGGSADLTVANALDKSFLAAVWSTEQGTGVSLATTTSNILPSTASTTSSGVGTCKPKSTVSIPVPGTPLDGTSSAISFWLNACLNADATGAEDLTYSGTITLVFVNLGDN